MSAHPEGPKVNSGRVVSPPISFVTSFNSTQHGLLPGVTQARLVRGQALVSGTAEVVVDGVVLCLHRVSFVSRQYLTQIWFAGLPDGAEPGAAFTVSNAMSYDVAFASRPAEPVLGAEPLRSSRLSLSTIVCASDCAPARK